MAGYGDKPFGLREVKLGPLPSGALVALPIAQTLKLTERVKAGELSGDDKIQAVVAYTDAAEWELEAGGISLEAWALMTGRTLLTSGSTPNAYITLPADAPQTMPYFKIYGKVMGTTDNVHCKIWKAKLTKAPEGTFADGEFYVMSCSGIAISDGTNGLFTIVQYETAANLPAT